MHKSTYYSFILRVLHKDVNVYVSIVCIFFPSISAYQWETFTTIKSCYSFWQCWLLWLWYHVTNMSNIKLNFFFHVISWFHVWIHVDSSMIVKSLALLQFETYRHHCGVFNIFPPNWFFNSFISLCYPTMFKAAESNFMWSCCEIFHFVWHFLFSRHSDNNIVYHCSQISRLLCLTYSFVVVIFVARM